MTDAPIIALTATAPHAIRTSVCSSLGLSEPAVILQTLDRPNIYLSTSKSRGLSVSSICARIHVHITLTIHLQSDFDGLVSLLKQADPKSIPKTLIFCHTKELAIKVYRLFIQNSPSKDMISVFHASLTQCTKEIVVHRFLSCESLLRIVIATVAFGMVCV